MTLQTSYDFIVVGAGSSGCTAAYRLAERSGANVLLIEAGGSDSSPLVKMPIGFAMMVGEGKQNWNYRSHPEPALGGRKVMLPRGRLLGGCSSINGMVYIRGQREDYDGWAAAGNAGWSYDDVLPIFKRSEGHWAGETEYHGAGGPLTVSSVVRPFPIADAFIAAADQCGIPENTDFNGARQAGAGYFDANIDRGIRHSSARAFLHNVPTPPTLTVLKNFEVVRLKFEGAKAVAVEGFSRGEARNPKQITARKSIVLSAGTFNTPRILEQSGIGAASRLEDLGIDVQVDAPEVGENLQDHCNNYLFYRTRNCESYYDHIKPHRAPATLANYVFRRRGIFANPAAIAGAFFNLEGDSQRPDTQIHFAAAASETDASGKLSPVPGVCASICQLQPESRGSVHVTSSDVALPPEIRLNFLSQENEQLRQVLALKKLRALFAQPSISPYLEAELPPMHGRYTDAELLQGIKESLESVHHAVGTCRMGPDATAVTNPELKVNGVDGLRIADASIMPRIVSGNTHAACVMIGEKLADLLL